MSELTDVVRRATMDMDVDFLHYSLANDSIRRFVSRLNHAAPCRIMIKGSIVTLKQQEYKGKRIYLRLTDDEKHMIETKIDIGVRAMLHLCFYREILEIGSLTRPLISFVKIAFSSIQAESQGRRTSCFHLQKWSVE